MDNVFAQIPNFSPNTICTKNSILHFEMPARQENQGKFVRFGGKFKLKTEKSRQKLSQNSGKWCENSSNKCDLPIF